jgi:hypothetical protein
MDRLENPERPAYELRKQAFSEENIHALTITMRVIPERLRIMLVGRANHRSDIDDSRASLYPVPGSYCMCQNLYAGRSARIIN